MVEIVETIPPLPSHLDQELFTGIPVQQTSVLKDLEGLTCPFLTDPGRDHKRVAVRQPLHRIMEEPIGQAGVGIDVIRVLRGVVIVRGIHTCIVQRREAARQKSEQVRKGS